MLRITRIILFLIMPMVGYAQSPTSGSFIKHIKTEKGYKLEIPDAILEKDILFGSRVVDVSSPSGKVFAAGQSRSEPVWVRLVKKGKYIVIRRIQNSYLVNEKDPITGALEANSLEGIDDVFEIESRGADAKSSVIDVTKFFSDEVSMAWPIPDNTKKGKLDSRFSAIEFMREYSDHINIRSHYEYTGEKNRFSITVQYYLLLLPESPLPLRYTDDRVGYQNFSLTSFASGESIRKNKYISRWRMEPKPEDVERHKKGALVEPVKPIVVYVEPYFPAEWIPHIKAGIEDWNVAFESAGFKNAIIAKEFPQNDKDFDPFDISTNVIRYMPVVGEANAAGEIWTDPRTGEIIQGDVLWWNDVINLLKMWRFTQTAAVDKEARGLKYNDQMMGEMVRYAMAHEIGHMLGLQHNMRASFAYSVDSLRSPVFTQRNGTTASIMDYARNNHVAQPGDLERGVKLTPPHLGPFDVLSIEYGYKKIYGANTPDDELEGLNKVFKSRGKDPKYIFGPMITAPISPDPAAQSDALGDDVVKSSGLGLKNTQYILEHFAKWTIDAGGNLSDVSDRYDALAKQYFRMINLTLSYIGGVYNIQGPYEKGGDRQIAVEKDMQRKAVVFALDELKKSTKYLDNTDLNTIIGSQSESLVKRQADVITSMVNANFFTRITTAASLRGKSKYTIPEFLTDVENQLLWTDANDSPGRQAMNIAYVSSLLKIAKSGDSSSDLNITGQMYAQFAYQQIDGLRTRLGAKISDKAAGNESHYRYLQNLINSQIK